MADLLKSFGNGQKIYNYIMQAEEKTTYDRPLTSICSVDVIAMINTYAGLVKFEKAPEIPDGCIALARTFEDCTSLAETPVIPESVKYMTGTFKGCTSLTGTLICHANHHEYDEALKGTQITAIEGSCSEETKTKLLGTK